MLKKTLICGVVFAALSANQAWAGEKSGHMFGGPVIFESSLSYGWVSDTSDQGLIQDNVDSLIVNNNQGGTFDALISLPGTNPAVPYFTQLNYIAPRIEAVVDNTQLFKLGFAHSQELTFGIRTEIADDLEAFIRFEYAQLKSNKDKRQAYNVMANVLTPYERSNGVITIAGQLFIEPGQISQTFTGMGTANIGFADMDIFNFNVGMKKDLFKPFYIASIETKLFTDFAFGFSATKTISVESSGQLPDLTNTLTADFSDRLVPFGQPDFTLLLPNRAITATSSLSQFKNVVEARVKPTIIFGVGIDFALFEQTALSLDVRYKYLHIPSIARGDTVNLSRLTMGLRLSQMF